MMSSVAALDPTRRRRSDGERTRRAILREAASLATVEGLEGLSIGNLAAALGMSKSGLYAHFGSKQELQLSTIDEARAIFWRDVVEQAEAAEPGLAQVLALADAYFAHISSGTFPGGCFFVGASSEMGTRPGPLKDRVVEFALDFATVIRGFLEAAVERGEVSPDDDLEQLTFELNGIFVAANINYVMSRDPAVLELASRVLRRRLGM